MEALAFPGETPGAVESCLADQGWTLISTYEHNPTEDSNIEPWQPKPWHYPVEALQSQYSVENVRLFSIPAENHVETGIFVRSAQLCGALATRSVISQFVA